MGEYEVGKIDAVDSDLWNVYHKTKCCIVGIFTTEADAIDVCEELNRKELGETIKSWPNV